jgi:hypothetical protein
MKGKEKEYNDILLRQEELKRRNAEYVNDLEKKIKEYKHPYPSLLSETIALNGIIRISRNIERLHEESKSNNSKIVAFHRLFAGCSENPISL